MQVAWPSDAVVASVQNVSCAPFDVNVQHFGLFGSAQSVLTWQMTTLVVSGHESPMCVGQLPALVQDVPIAVAVQLLPEPVVTATPQHTGVVPPHSSGPSHSILSPDGQLAGATHEYVVVALGCEQQTCVSGHAVFPPQPKSYVGPSGGASLDDCESLDESLEPPESDDEPSPPPPPSCVDEPSLEPPASPCEPESLLLELLHAEDASVRESARKPRAVSVLMRSCTLGEIAARSRVRAIFERDSKNPVSGYSRGLI
jgi:hypothetical protein